MSRLSDAIRRVQRTEAARMGFGPARAAPKATMLVGVLAPAAAVAPAGDKGADVAIIDGRETDLSVDEVKRARLAVGEAPLGAWLGEVSRDAAAEMTKAGLDFIVVSPQSTPAEALLVEDLGFVLMLPESPEELFLRSLEALSLDALWLARVPSPLNVAGQLELNKIGLLARRPLVSEVAATASKSDLECLRAAGVVLLVLGPGDGVDRLKETVMSLPGRRLRREERPAVALPRAQAPVEEDEEDDE